MTALARPLAMEPAERDDADLVRATLAGDGGAFQRLVERYQERLFGLARHYVRGAVELEDVVQDTFLKAYHRLESFQHQASFSTWLHRIAINTCLDHLKRRGRSPVRAVEDPELAAADPAGAPFGTRAAPPPDARLEREEVARITHAVLEELPEIFRTVLVLREFEELAYQEIADLLGISIGTVESRLFRARARFKEALLRRHPELARDDA